MMTLPVVQAPRYELTVPSTGKKVEYRPYLVKEEKAMIIAIESKDSKNMIRVIRDIVSACTFNKVNANDLPLFDVEYIFLKLRSVSVGEMTHFGLTCEHCNANNEVQLNLNEVELTGEMKKPEPIQITDKIGVVLKYPTVKDTLKFSPEEDGSDYDTVISTIVASIDSIYDEETVHDASLHTKEELVGFVESLSQAQFRKLNQFFETIPVLEKTIEFNCIKCKEPNSKTVKGIRNFFK